MRRRWDRLVDRRDPIETVIVVTRGPAHVEIDGKLCEISSRREGGAVAAPPGERSEAHPGLNSITGRLTGDPRMPPARCGSYPGRVPAVRIAGWSARDGTRSAVAAVEPAVRIGFE